MNAINLYGRLTVCSICYITVPQLANGQQAANDTISPTTTLATALRQYDASFEAHPQLVNGPEYVDYAQRYNARVGNQFFQTAELQFGSVEYNEHLFQNQQLKYDVVLDQLIIRHPTSPLLLRLIEEKVRTFTIADHHFIRLVADTVTGTVVGTGYYEVLQEGPVQILARRSKRLQKQVSQKAINASFTGTDKLLARKAGVYQVVGSKAAALRLFADRLPEMQAYVRQRNLTFRKAQLESTLADLAHYYATLPPR